MKIINALILVYIACGHAIAATDNPDNDLQQYDVEIIIFEDAHARYINAEAWNQPNHIDPLAIELDDAQIPYEAIEIKEAGHSNLNKFTNIKPGILESEYKRINNSSEYKVLLYSAWRQTGLAEEDAFDISIDALTNNHTSKSDNTITGTLKVILARYLHLYGELEYIRKDTASLQNNAVVSTGNINENQRGEFNQSAEQTQIAANKFPIKLHRRMRSKELHYIDHPLVGILVQINPVDKAK